MSSKKDAKDMFGGAPRDWSGQSFAGLTDHLSFNIPHSYEDSNAQQWTQPLTFL